MENSGGQVTLQANLGNTGSVDGIFTSTAAVDLDSATPVLALPAWWQLLVSSGLVGSVNGFLSIYSWQKLT
jgi:hypothetical protein